MSLKKTSSVSLYYHIYIASYSDMFIGFFFKFTKVLLVQIFGVK